MEANGYCRFDRETFGRVVAIYAGLAGQHDRTAELNRRFLDFATRFARGQSGGAAELPFEYVIMVGRRC